MNKFTSFVAVEHKIVNPSDIAQIIPVPVDLPEGWEYHKVFGGLPQLVEKSPTQKMKSPTQKIKTQPQTMSSPSQISHIRSPRISLPGTATNMPIYFVFGIGVIFISLVMLIRQRIEYVK